MTKRVIRFFTNFEQEERWLNEMAAQGWHCESYVFGRYTFAAGKPGEYIYRLQLLEQPVNHPDSADYIEFLREAGVEVVASCFRWVYLRKKAAEGPFELFSDRSSRIDHYKKIIAMLLPLTAANLAFALDLLSEWRLRPLFNLLAGTALAVPVLGYYKRIRQLEREGQVRE